LSKRKFPEHVTFGVEFELFKLNPNGDWDKARVAAYYISKGIQATIADRTATNYTVWQIKPDSSIHPGRVSQGANAFPFELVGPILKGKEGLEIMKRVLEITKELGVLVNKSCGFHVHIGETAWNNDPNMLKGIVKNFIKHELAFDCMVPPSRRNNPYCLSNNGSNVLAGCSPHKKI